MLFELLTGLTVFPQETDAEIVVAVTRGEFPPPESHLPPPLAAVIRHCLQLDPAQRYESVDEMSWSLQEAERASVQATGVPAVLPEPRPRQPQ
jgi:eukaryotic-like serine/threonine-protein kinase